MAAGDQRKTAARWLSAASQPASWTAAQKALPRRAFEIICCDCGDDPGLEYFEVSRRLWLIRGPYPIATGIAAYETHLKLHCHTEAAGCRWDHPMPDDRR